MVDGRRTHHLTPSSVRVYDVHEYSPVSVCSMDATMYPKLYENFTVLIVLQYYGTSILQCNFSEKSIVLLPVHRVQVQYYL